MSQRVIKIDSNQASFDTTQSKSICDIDLPANIGNVDLSKSYILITTQPTITVDGDVAGDVKNPYLGYTLQENQRLHCSDTASLIRNANFSSRKGRIEDVRHLDILKNTLSVYKNDLAQVQSGQSKLATIGLGQQFPSHQNNEISKIEDILSRQSDHDIHIPLGNIWNSCKSSGFDTGMGAHGNSRLHLEFNFQLLQAHKNGGVVAASTVEGTAVLVRDFVAPAVNGGADANYTELTTTALYKNKVNSPWFVGNAVAISSRNDGAAAATVQRKIIKVEPQSTGAIKLTFDGNISAAIVLATKVLTEIKITDNQPTAPNIAAGTVAISKIQLVAVLSDAAPPAKLNYTTFDSEEDNYPATISTSRMYNVPPAVKNVYVMFFGDSGSTKMRSENEHLSTYRVSLDNKDITPRPIVVGSAMHKDLINNVFTNNQDSVKSLRESQLVDGGFSTADQLAGEKCRMIAIPIPFKPTQTQLQLELNASTGEVLTGHHILFYEKAMQM